nr:MAG TPA: hypothetical protein [Caudoviricetes sp.]
MIANYHLDLHRHQSQNLYHLPSWTDMLYTTLSKTRSDP